MCVLKIFSRVAMTEMPTIFASVVFFVFGRSCLFRLLVSFFACRSPFGVVLRFCVGCRVILRGRWL